MNLKHLTDDELLANTDRHVKHERAHLNVILHHFREINRRRLFSAQECESLHQMVVKIYGYDSQEAYKRIAAMHLLNEIPEVEEQVANGELTLTHLNLARTLFRKEEKIHDEKMAKQDKIAILQEIANQTTTKAKQIVLSHSSAPIELEPDLIRVVSPTHVQMSYVAKNEVREKLEQLKGLLAHKHPGISMGELMNLMCDLALKELDPGKLSPEKKCRGMNSQNQSARQRNTPSNDGMRSKAAMTAKPHSSLNDEARSKPLFLSKAETRRMVFRKAHNKCTNCGSHYAPQTDHIIAKAKGGLDLLENFRLLCRNCNQREAIQDFGQAKMDIYLARNAASPPHAPTS